MTPLEEFIFNPDDEDEEQSQEAQERIKRVLDLLV